MRQGFSKLERSLRENCDLFVKRGSMMSWRWALLLLALLLPSQGLVLAQLSKQAPDFDVRGPRESTLPAPAAAVLPEQSQALTDLSDEAEGDLTISWSALTGAPSRVGRRGGTLTLPMNAPPHAIANVFLSRFRSLLNLSPQDVAEIEFSRDFTTQHNGVSHLTLQQQASGVDVYGRGIKVSIDAEGRIINVSGEPIPNLHSSVNINTPVISSDEAVLAAAAAAGVNNVSESSSLGLIYFPLAPGNVRLAWKVTFQDADSPNLYESIVDAVDGTVLWRQSLTDYNHIPAQGQVFTSDSPEPNTPKDSPITGVSRQTVSFTGEDFFPHDDPHYDWWDGADRIITTSNNVDAYLDVNGNDVADTDSRAEAADEDFSFALDLAMDPTTYQDAAVTNLFYWNNRLHDFFYRLGFDEASGNFQDDNLGLGGILAFGGDAVNAEAQDNSQPPSMDPDDRSLCNANMSTPGDGSSPKMQMFLCVSKRCSENEFKGCRTNADCSGTCDPWTDNFPTPERDGDFDNVVIGHEYTHGVHKRLVPTMGNQRANEGWSDYFGLSLVAEPDDPYDGAYGVGDYLFNLLGDGIRSYPYSTDLSVYKRTYADINDRASCAEKVCSGELDKICSEDSDCDAGQECDSVKCEFHTDCQEPVTEADLGLCTLSEHRTGEVWANALWIARMNLIEKFGYASGANTMNQVIIDGMKMSPDNPTFLDGRDAILDADLATNGGVNSCLIWDAFARMGMGVSALTTDKNDITPLEAFDVPTACAPVSQVNAPSDFGEVCEGDFSTLTLTVFNTGSGDLILYGVERTDGSDDITVDSQPETPVFVSADAHVDFTVRCSPTTGGTKTATITVESNDTANPTRDIVYTCDSGQATLDTVYDGSYGNVCLGDKLTQELRILNEGACVFEVDDITISNVGDNDFNLATVMSFPFTVAPGGEITVPIEFEPVGDTDPESATIRIYHDADSPPSPKTLSANGHSEDAVVNTLIANAGSFGEVCAGDFWDLDLAVNNDGTCPLEIDSATIVLGANAQGGDFSTPAGNAAGTIVEPGNSVQLPIRFSPSAFDNDPPLERLGTVELDSHTHLASPSTLPTDSTPISGAVPPPDINVAIANSGDFGNVCKGDHADLNLTLFNQGKCDLTITDIKIMGADADSFELPSIPPLQLPLVLSPDADFNLPIRYAPDECTDIPETATIVITSDDPDDDPVNIPISGTSPCPNLVIDPVALTALYSFPPTVVDTQGTLGCFSEQNVVLRNESECPLTITDISAEGTLNSLDFGVTAPTEFPIFLPGGEETLDVTVRFTPQSDDNPLAPSELVGALTVVSDDPDDIPVGERMADLCGESAAQSGVRILVTDISSGTDVPVDEVDSITIQSKGKNRPGPINLMFTDRPLVPDAMVCGNLVLYHVDQETLPSTATTGSNPKSSYQNKAMEGNLQTTENYSLNQCEFRESQLQLQDSDSEDCLLAPKGADCTTDGECCSGKCKGPSGAKTCK